MRIKLKADGPSLHGKFRGNFRGREYNLTAGDILEGADVGPLAATYPDDFERLADVGASYQAKPMERRHGAS